MKYLKQFANQSDYQAFKEGEEYVTPNVSFVVESAGVMFNPYTAPASPNVVCTYNVTDISQETMILGYDGRAYVTNMIVDGVEMDINCYYQFDTVGNHVIEFVLYDPTKIGGYAFQDCTGLTSITIPDSVTSIGNNAFCSCSGLTSVHIGSGVTSIESNAFEICPGLVSIVVSSGNTVYDSRENCNCIIETATNTLIQGCNNSFIPDSVTSIGNNAFFGYEGLTGELVIPDSVTSIGNYAFSGCTGLTSIVIPDSVETIGEAAFNLCSRLTSIVIPDSVTSIGNNAFYYCSGLTSITSYAVTAPTIGDSTFYNVKNGGILKVPAGSDYSSWLKTRRYYLGYHNWTVEYV